MSAPFPGNNVLIRYGDRLDIDLMKIYCQHQSGAVYTTQDYTEL